MSKSGTTLGISNFIESCQLESLPPSAVVKITCVNKLKNNARLIVSVALELPLLFCIKYSSLAMIFQLLSMVIS